MKRTTLLRVCAVCLLTVLLCPLLFACISKDPAETAPLPPPPDKGTQEESLYATLLDNLARQSAVTVRTETDYSFTDDRSYRYWFSSTEVYVDLYTEDMFFCRDRSDAVEYGGNGIQNCVASNTENTDHVFVSREGYADGYMFQSVSFDGLTTTAKTAMTARTYCDLVGSCYYSNLLAHFDSDGCEASSRRKLDDGSWELKFVGLSEENLSYLSDQYVPNITFISGSIRLAGATVTVIATPQFTFDSIRIDLKLDRYNENDAYVSSYPTMRYTMTFEEGADMSAADIPLEDYADIGDLRMPTFFGYGLDKRKEAARGQYTYSDEEYYTLGEEATFQKQSDVFNFNYTSDGDLTYRMTGSYESHEEAWNIAESYENGKLILRDTNPVTGEINESEIPASPEEVLRWMTDYMDVPEYSVQDITRIEILDEKAGKYRFHLGLWLEKGYADSYRDAGADMTDFTAYLDVTLYNGNLYEYTYHIECTAKMPDRQTETYSREISWIFEKAARPTL